MLEESFHHQNVLSTYYVLALGMQKKGRIPPPKEALTIVGKTDNTARPVLKQRDMKGPFCGDREFCLRVPMQDSQDVSLKCLER